MRRERDHEPPGGSPVAVGERYDEIGPGYALHRRADARWARHLGTALGGAHSVLDVGAGTGSYEPQDRAVVAVEPSAAMIAQRAPGSPPVVRARAERLPFRSGGFDAAMAVLTLHHWEDWGAGLREMRRVARRVVLVTWDPAHPGFWLVRDYFPDLLALDRRIFPPLAAIARVLGSLAVQPLPVPHDCTDGFLGAFWRRPATYLDPGARAAISSFARLDDVPERLVRLAGDLESGAWHARHGQLEERTSLDLGYRLITAAGRA